MTDAPDNNVVKFPKDGPAYSADCEPVVLLEDITREARAGGIACIGIVTISPAGVVGTSWATDGGPHAHSLVAGANYLLRRVIKNAGCDE